MAAGKKSGGRTLILLALVVIVGAGGAFFMFRDRFLGTTDTEESVAEGVETDSPVFEVANVVDIYVLQQPLSRGQVIEEGHLLPVSYPRERFMEGLFITNPGDAVGKRALYDLEAGLPITFSMISGSTEGSYASFQIPKGYVAVTIPIDDELGISAVAYTLRAGDHVNVISSMLFVDLNQEWQTVLPDVVTPVYSPAANEPQPDAGGGEGETETAEQADIPTEFIPVTAQVDTPLGLMPWYGATAALPGVSSASGQEISVYTVPSETQRPRLVSQTIIQDAIILWVGDYPLTDPEAESVVLNEDGTVAESAVAPTDPNAEVVVEAEEPEVPRVVTLVVSPQDAVTLNYLMLQDAQLSLALRAAGDDQRIDTESVTLQFIMQQYNIPLPTPLEYGIEPRVNSLEFYEEVPVYTTP